MKLFGYWRSGTTYRVRLALALKGIEARTVPVDLTQAEHRGDAFRALNPSGAVPTLQLDDGTLISQSSAIIEYLEERFPEPALLPLGAKARARVRQMAGIIGMDIHPVQNLRIQKYLKQQLDQPQAEVDAWINTWVTDGFAALEALLAADPTRGSFCFGGRPGMAECYLIPQLYSARRFGVDVSPFTHILAVEEAAKALAAFTQAAPERQPEAS